MNPIVVLPCHKGDFESAKSLVAWMNELHPLGGGVMFQNDYSLLIAADAVDRNELVALAETAKKSFLHVFAIQINVPPNNQGWVKGSDYMFLKVAEWVKRYAKSPFLWMEPDAIPLKPGWRAVIFNEYANQPYRYMGAVVRQSSQPDMPKAHLNGNAVYPNDAIDTFGKIQAIYQGTQPFDIASAAEVVPATFNSPLFQSFWGTPDLPPIFVKDRKADAPQHHIDFEKFLRPDAVFFHRDKTHSLIPLLREKLNAPPVKTDLKLPNLTSQKPNPTVKTS